MNIAFMGVPCSSIAGPAMPAGAAGIAALLNKLDGFYDRSILAIDRPIDLKLKIVCRITDLCQKTDENIATPT
ncbi:hypothetical protein [Microcoleus sp. CAWBG58]|uniref:hypothetical protein n=1 Tax=Microcoleus sp. CAWBG58 TaxID=2841651 RepID=UPI0025D3C264|nr:hypothetical protein [Microcoleus sp. CAWBG58]